MNRRRVAVTLGLFIGICMTAQWAGSAWWETGYDRWYYKDDWKAEYLSGGGGMYGTTVTIPSEFVAAWVEVWAGGQYTLRVNGELVGSDMDAGTIEAYDITPHLHLARNQLVISGQREVIVEGGVVLKNGRIVPIRSDASWASRRGVKASRKRHSGPRDYAGNAHMALMLDYTPEQRAKATVSRLHSLAGRLLDRDRYRFWRERHPGEVLRLDSPEREIWIDVVEDSTEATTTAELTKPVIARGDWDAVERILNAPPRPVAPHLIDTAADFDLAIRLLRLRNDYTELKLQLALLREGGPLPDPAWMGRLRRIASDLARLRSPQTQERLLPYLASELERDIEAFRSEIEGRLNVRLDPLNRSTQNRLGWVISNEPLDNDPRQWEFSFAPPSADVLDLAGLWRFRLDPKNEGLDAGFARGDLDDSNWNRITAPHKWGWERLGYDQDNPLFRGKNNKPYNGHAWYRKTVVLPAAWKNRDLELALGVRRPNNRDWLYANGQPVGDAEARANGSQTGRFMIPAAVVRPATTNTIAIRVYNRENCGGLLGPHLMLYPVESKPETFRTVCQAGIVHEATYPALRDPKSRGARQVAYCGALSPAVLVSQTDRRFRLWGWETKGYPAPSILAYLGGEKENVQWLTPRLSIKGDALDRGWLMLAPDPRKTAKTSSSQVLLICLQRRPKEVRWESDGFGGSALVLDFATSPGIVGLVRPFGKVVPIQIDPQGKPWLRPFTDGMLNRWVRLVRAYPVAFAELHSTTADGNAYVQIGYDCFETDDDWGTEHVPHAPMPLLFSYACENGWPGARSELAGRLTPGAVATADPTATYTGAYMARIGSPFLAYTYDPREPRVHWKGPGTWTEIREMTDDDFAKMRAWGATACRPQIAFHANWFVRGFFEVEGRKSGLEGRLKWDASAVEWLDRIIDLHRRHDITCILNWFWNADYPLDEINGAPPNSSRYWKYKPAARQLIIDFWGRVAGHCADLPRDAIAYDFLNEPATLYVDDYNEFIQDATAAVRAKDKVHTIFVESANGWAQAEDFDRLRATGDDNTVYEFHFYGPHAYDSYQRDLWFPRYRPEWESYLSREALEERLLAPIRFSIRNGGAELCHGEFGITFLGPGEAPRRWLEALLTLHEKYRTHWIWWHWSGHDIHRTGLVAGQRLNPLVSTLSEFMRK